MHARAHDYFNDARWEEAAELYTSLAASDQLDPDGRLEYGIALANCAQFTGAADVLSTLHLKSPSDRAKVRRLAVTPALKGKNFKTAEMLLRRLAVTKSDDTQNLMTLANVLTRIDKRQEAIETLKTVCRLEPENVSSKSLLLQAYLQTKQQDKARDFATKNEQFWSKDIRFAQLSALTLARSNDQDAAFRAASVILAATKVTADAAKAAAQIFSDANDSSKTLAMCEKAFGQDEDSSRLRYLKAKVLHEQQADPIDIEAELERALALDPNHLASLTMIGKLLMRLGKNAEAAAYLEQVTALAPDMVHSQARLGQALKHAGKFDEAANILHDAVAVAPKADGLSRMTMSALVQAGREEEAAALFGKYKEAKRRTLPNSLESGLEFLEAKLSQAEIPKARLAWAWDISTGHLPPEQRPDRQAWEDKAKWGNLAEQMLRDWLETSSNQNHDVANMLGDLTPMKDLFASLMTDDRGLVIASAHVGPMFAGPVALRQIQIKHQWLASTPQISTMAYADELISTSDKTGLEVIAALYTSLSEGNAVTIAVDGALSPATPRVEFEGQSVTYSDFAARMSYRLKLGSVFAAPYWEGQRIQFLVEPLPECIEDEKIGSFVERWNDAYFSVLRDYLKLGPENLLLKGGIWRDVK